MKPRVRYRLRCRDAKTNRSATCPISASLLELNGPHLIIALAATMMRAWRGQYGVNFPHERVEWDVITITEAAAL